MTLAIHAALAYDFAHPTDILLQVEAAATAGQTILATRTDIAASDHIARVPALDGVGERTWLRVCGRLVVDYRATVAIDRAPADVAGLAAVPFHQLPGAVVPYLMASRYCPSDLFETFVAADFSDLSGGAAVAAMRDWIARCFTYAPGSSTSATTALESYVARQGVCRDYAHVLVTMARAAGVPARVASAYAPDVTPPDFHLVAEVYLDGAWHPVDATGMARADELAIVGVGRDAADVSFLTSYGEARFWSQTVDVVRSDAPSAPSRASSAALRSSPQA